MSNRKISETTKLLIDAKKVIEKEENWCQNSFTKPIGYSVKDATSFCSLGTFMKTANSSNRAMGTEYKKAYDLLNYVCGGDNSVHCIGVYNDTHTHKEVMAMWDDAIALSVKRDQEGE